ncbi:hypothetical protein [Kribbella sp. DT2]
MSEGAQPGRPVVMAREADVRGTALWILTPAEKLIDRPALGKRILDCT